MFEREKHAWKQVWYGVKCGADTWWRWDEIEHARKEREAIEQGRDLRRIQALGKLLETDPAAHDSVASFITNPTEAGVEAFVAGISALDEADQIRLVKWAFSKAKPSLIMHTSMMRWSMNHARAMADLHRADVGHHY